MLANSIIEMNYQKIGVLLSLLLLGSCSYFNQSSSKLLSSKDTIIDFHSIDTYPIFPKCTELVSKEEQKQCFYTEITQQIQDLLQQSFLAKKALNDTIFIQLKVDKKGIITPVNTNENNPIQRNIPQFDSIIKSQLKQLTTVQPATKQGIPITTEFTLPIIINTGK